MLILLGPLSAEKRFVWLVGIRECEIFGEQDGIRSAFAFPCHYLLTSASHSFIHPSSTLYNLAN
jgi:hypothetical protein